MTKEEALKVLDTIPTISEQVDALEMAIKTLEQQPCEDAISREALNEEFLARCIKNCDICKYKDKMSCKLIIDAPSVSRKKGKWIKAREWSEGFGMGEVYGWFYECSECGKQVKGGYPECSYNYCPYCGSDNRDLESLGESFADGYENGLEEKR